MARGRMISKTLSTSVCYARLFDVIPDLAEFAQSLYPLLVAHADDFGREQGDITTVKYRIHPRSPRSEADFSLAMDALRGVGLIDWYVAKGRECYQIAKFDDHQTGLHKRTRSQFPPYVSGKFPEVPGQEKGRELKGTELNGTEGKGIEKSEKEQERPLALANASRPLFDGRNARRHGQHAWCDGDRNLCVTAWVHEELVGKRGGPAFDAEIRLWYAATIAELRDQVVGEKSTDDFWRGKFAEQWPPAARQVQHGKSAQSVANARRAFGGVS